MIIMCRFRGDARNSNTHDGTRPNEIISLCFFFLFSFDLQVVDILIFQYLVIYVKMKKVILAKMISGTKSRKNTYKDKVEMANGMP